jgi:hypothetical protein
MVSDATVAGQPQGTVMVLICAQAGTAQVEQTAVEVTVGQEALP